MQQLQSGAVFSRACIELVPKLKSDRGVGTMNPIAFAMRRPITTLMLVAGLISGGVLALKKRGVDVLPALDTSRIQVVKSKVHAVLDSVGMGTEPKEPKEHPHGEHHKIVVSSPKAKDVVLTQEYVCQIH